MSNFAFFLRLDCPDGTPEVCRVAETEKQAVELVRKAGYAFETHTCYRKNHVMSMADFSRKYNAGAKPRVLNTANDSEMGELMTAAESHIWSVVFFDSVKLVVPAFLFNQTSEFIIASEPRAGVEAGLFHLTD